MGSALNLLDRLVVRWSAWSIGLVLLVELAIAPWTAHAYDATAFLSHSDRIYFGHVAITALWAYGSISLAAVLFSQLPVLVFPQLWSVSPLRILFLKVPTWCADLATAAIVRACAADARWANAWALRYLLDPAVVFVTVFHGQLDALPNVFTVLGIALMLAGRYELGGLAFGLGAGTKFYPAAFVPLLMVAAYRGGSSKRAALSFATFAGAATLSLVPVLWGRAASVFAAYANNSFGPEGVGVSVASLWTLLPRTGLVSLAPQVEQLIGVAIPVLLAAWELRHRPSRIDLARAAMLSAMSIVLLNPGAHPPFYLWIAGPLVLYAAVADDGIVSMAGFVLSCTSILMQFCQEGSDEYFLMNFGTGPGLGLLRCVAPSAVLAGVAFASTAAIVVASYRRTRVSESAASAFRRATAIAAPLVFTAFVAAVVVETASAAAARKPPGFLQEERAINTFAIDPVVRALPGGRCRLIYAANDIIVYAGNPFAARFGTASLGYTLFSPQELSAGGRGVLSLKPDPSKFENIDVRTIGERTVRITREFDVTAALRPFRYVERFVERPCNLIRDNPLLIYRFDFDAAQAAAIKKPLLERLNVFAREAE